MATSQRVLRVGPVVERRQIRDSPGDGTHHAVRLLRRVRTVAEVEEAGLDRLGFLREHVDLASASVLEIGALDRPVVSSGAAEVRYLDHLDTPGLKAKYGPDPAVDKDRIVDVRYVWNGGPVSAAVDDGRRFDVIVASHVFEHLCDPVGWLQDIRGLLADGGRIFLVLPDRRFTFDIARDDTTLSDWVGWHLRKLRKPAPDQVFDHFSLVRAVSAERVWRGAPAGEFETMYELRVAYDLAASVAADDRYVDVHCSVFTPYGFVALCRGLGRLNLLPFTIEAFRPTRADQIEFFALLQVCDDAAVPGIDQKASQALARQAGYAGAFGGGLFAQARAADPALGERYEKLVAAARAEAEAAWAARAAGRFPEVDPALHHAPPRPGDRRL